MALALRRRDVDLATGVLTVRKDKARAGRKLTLSAGLLDWLRPHLADKLPEAYVFPGADGGLIVAHDWNGPTKAAVRAASASLACFSACLRSWLASTRS